MLAQPSRDFARVLHNPLGTLGLSKGSRCGAGQGDLVQVFCRQLAQRSCHGHLYRDLVRKALIEISYRDLAKRSLREILPTDLLEI